MKVVARSAGEQETKNLRPVGACRALNEKRGKRRANHEVPIEKLGFCRTQLRERK